MHFTKLSFDDYMIKVASLIGNSLSDNSIVSATGRFGYDENRIKEGEKLFREVENINSRQQEALNNKVNEHEKRKQIQTVVRKNYMKILQIARIAFDKDVIVNKALQLEGPRQVSLDLWINQVALFCNRLLADENWLAKIKVYGISKDDVSGLMTQVENLRLVAITCENAKTEAKKHTALKKTKLKVLQDWVSDYLKIARIALDEQPNVLAKLKV